MDRYERKFYQSVFVHNFDYTRDRIVDTLKDRDSLRSKRFGGIQGKLRANDICQDSSPLTSR